MPTASVTTGAALRQDAGLLTPAELADMLGNTVKTLAKWRWKRTGPPFVKAGKRVMYSKLAVHEWLNQKGDA